MRGRQRRVRQAGGIDERVESSRGLATIRAVCAATADADGLALAILAGAPPEFQLPNTATRPRAPRGRYTWRRRSAEPCGAGAQLRLPAAMANVTFEAQWKEGMIELLDQLELLDPLNNASVQESLDTQEPSELFQHYATLYIRYLQASVGPFVPSAALSGHASCCHCCIRNLQHRRSSASWRSPTTRWSTRRSVWTSRRRSRR